MSQTPLSEVSPEETRASQKHSEAELKCDASSLIRSEACRAFLKAEEARNKAIIAFLKADEKWRNACMINEKLWAIQKKAFAEYVATWED